MSAISIITNKVSLATQKSQNYPLNPIYLIAQIDDIVFKVQNNMAVFSSSHWKSEK